MFERYSENARRTLFFSRYESQQLGSDSIEPAHLVLGALRENAHAILQFADAGETADTIRERLVSALVAAAPIDSRVEVPFSPASKRVLQKAAAEADGLGNHTIRPEHLILGIAVDTIGPAARALQQAGVQPNAIREFLRGTPDDPPSDYVRTSAVLSARAIAAGVIRQWKGVVKPGFADDYVEHLRQETLPALARLEGFVSVTIMRREIDDGTEFQVATTWRTLDAIRAFAGADVTRAVVPPAAQALMVRYDDHATHYEIVQ